MEMSQEEFLQTSQPAVDLHAALKSSSSTPGISHRESSTLRSSMWRGLAIHVVVEVATAGTEALSDNLIMERAGQKSRN